MAIGIENYVNIDTSEPAKYPNGAIKDNDGSNNGTPVDRNTYNDLHQVFDKLLRDAGITANGLPESEVDSYQYLFALISFVRGIAALETAAGTAEIATTAETTAGTADDKIITPLKLSQAVTGAWTLRSDTSDISFLGGGGNACTSSNIKYRVIGKTMHVQFTVICTNTTSPITFQILIPASKTYAGGFNINIPGFAETTPNGRVLATIAMLTTDTTHIRLASLTALDNAATATISGSITFEIA